MLGVYKSGGSKMRPRLVTNGVCVGDVPTGDHHRVIGHLGLYFRVFSYLKSQRCFIFYCQLYFLVRFFSCIVFVFWFTCWLDIFDSKACLTCKMQIFN